MGMEHGGAGGRNSPAWRIQLLCHQRTPIRDLTLLHAHTSSAITAQVNAICRLTRTPSATFAHTHAIHTRHLR